MIWIETQVHTVSVGGFHAKIINFPNRLPNQYAWSVGRIWDKDECLAFGVCEQLQEAKNDAEAEIQYLIQRDHANA